MWAALSLALAVSALLGACHREPAADAPARGALDPAGSPTASLPTLGEGTPALGAMDVAAALRTALGGAHPAALRRWTAAEGRRLDALYLAGGDAPLWVDAAGRPTPDAREALALLAGAAGDGLDPEDYGAAALPPAAAALAAAASVPPAAEVAAFDLALSAGVLRYLQELHEGRVDPRTIGFKMTAPPDHHDFAAVLRAALAAHRLSATVADFTPAVPLYHGLREALARYRRLAADPTLAPPPTTATVHVGEPYPPAAALEHLLAAFGDLPADAARPGEPPTYDERLEAGVRHFQGRHGLEVDGVLGTATQRTLQVPLSWRVRQLELALERLRWLPHLAEDRFLTVNIPMFRLLAWGPAARGGPPAFTTGVIVGRALDRQTPVFVEELSQVIFRPYWNVPPSIARGEILPALARDSGYLQRHDMEIVAGPGDDARPVAVTAESLARVHEGTLRVRQRPGAANSLGLVKLVFPNDDNVYMHGTPAPELFRRSRRDFSHGCVRVEDPVGLAEWVLAGEDGWSRDRIRAAMDASRSSRVTLARPIQVILFYVTAVVSAEDGTVRFADDVYGHDARLDRALARLSER